MTLNPLLKGGTRPFVIEGGARADHRPVYQSCWVLGTSEQSMGDAQKIECPDPNKYNAWIPIGEFQGAEGRSTSSVMTRLSLNQESALRRISKKRCKFDIQAHSGVCKEPSNPNDCDKVTVFEGCLFTNYSRAELGSLSSDGQGEIDESANFSAEQDYELLPLSFADRSGSAVTNSIVDVVICDAQSCGDCEDESDGCEIIFAVDDGSTGSPGTQPDVLWSVDRAITVAADNISSLVDGDDATGIACVGIYVVVTSNVDGSISYKEKTVITAGTLGSWVTTKTGVVTGGEPNDIWSVGNYAFVVGDGGYVYGTSDPTAGLTVLDAGVATSNNLNAVHAISEEFAVAVGASDTIIYTENGTIWKAATATGSAAALNCVWIIDENYWFVGTAGGALYYTLDKGATWTAKALPGTSWSAINDIQFSSRTNGFIAADKSTTKGYVLRTWDGGYSWFVAPSLAGAIAADSIKALAACPYDHNLVYGVGTADSATDGILIVGQD